MLESPAAPAAPLFPPAAPPCALAPAPALFDVPPFEEPAWDVEVPPALVASPALPLAPIVPAVPELAPEPPLFDEPHALTPLANESQSGAESAKAGARKRAPIFLVCMVRIPQSGRTG
jgi:hypothetical protein